MLDQPWTSRQAIALLMMFNFGSSVVMGVSTEAAQDSWISLLLAILIAIPVILMYGRILELNPHMDMFDAMEALLGKVVGKAAIALMTWYALHLCALVLRNFSEFIQLATLLDTPQLPVLIIMLLAVCYLAKSGCKALGKWALVTLPVVLAVVALTVILSLNVMRFDNILPIFGHSVGRIVSDAFQIVSFPFCETVLFLSIADCLHKDDNPRKIYLTATIFSGVVLLIVIFRNLFVLGAEVVAIEYFPSYVAARIINLGDFLSRIEGSISVNFILAGITKITVCLLAASKGLAKLFGAGDYRRLIMPAGFLAVALAMIIYNNIMEMFGFIKYYAIYAAPFEVLLPALLWIVSEIRAKRAPAAAARG